MSRCCARWHRSSAGQQQGMDGWSRRCERRSVAVWICFLFISSQAFAQDSRVQSQVSSTAARLLAAGEAALLQLADAVPDAGCFGQQLI